MSNDIVIVLKSQVYIMKYLIHLKFDLVNVSSKAWRYEAALAL